MVLLSQASPDDLKLQLGLGTTALDEGQQTLFCKRPASKHFWCCRPYDSVTVTQLCHWGVNAAITWCGCVPVKLHLPKQVMGSILSPDCSLLSPAPDCHLHKDKVVGLWHSTLGPWHGVLACNRHSLNTCKSNQIRWVCHAHGVILEKEAE